MEHRVAGRDHHGGIVAPGHLIDASCVPCGNDVVLFHGILFDFFYRPSELVDRPLVTCWPPPPLNAVYRTQVSPTLEECGILLNSLDKLFIRERLPGFIFHRPSVFHVCPLIPNVDVIVDEVFDIAVSGKEPDKLMDDPPRKYFLRCKERKTLREVITANPAENAFEFHSRGMAYFPFAVLHDVFHEVKILIFRMSSCIHMSYDP